MGGGTKRFLGRVVEGTPIDVRPHRGIVNYDPAELVLTARCGTPLAEIEAALDERGQMLACEPPHFGPDATFGGAIASGLSGPRRPWSGAVRDHVLGCRLIDGQARVMRFGGEVIKNVAGYDVSRLLTGSYGCLGILTEVSMKVLPKPLFRKTLRLDMSAVQAVERLAEWARTPLPITGACHYDAALFVRLEGGRGSVDAGAARIGGCRVDDGFWTELREHRLRFFEGAQPLWRLSLPPSTPPVELPGQVLLDWGGAQHWLRTGANAAQVRRAAERLRGSAIAYRGCDSEPFHPLSGPLLVLHRQLKEKFDPRGIFNRGRLYATL